MYGMYGLLANKKERNDGSHVHSLFEGQLCEIDLLDPYRKDHQSKMVDDVYSSSSFCSVHWLSQYKGERMTSSVTNECFGNGCKASDATRLDLKRHKWMSLILHLHSEHKTGKTWKRNDIIIIIRSVLHVLPFGQQKGTKSEPMNDVAPITAPFQKSGTERGSQREKN